MKKLMIVAAFVFVAMGSVFAQKEHGVRGEMKVDPKERAEKMSQRFKTDLELNDEQYTKLLALNTESAIKREAKQKEMKAEMEVRRAAVKVERAAYTANLKAILTTEQYIKYLETRGERMDEKGNARRVRSPRKRMH